MTKAGRQPGFGRAEMWRQDPIRVEFFGLPGSGKTTIARELHGVLARAGGDFVFAADMLRDDDGARARAAAKIRLILSGLVRERGASLGILLKAFRFPQPSFRDRLRSASTLTTVTSLNAYLQHHHINAILDQGILQALWTVQLRSTPAVARSLFAEMLGAASSDRRIFVAVETPPETCAARLRGRESKHSRMQSSDLQRDSEVWDHAEFLRRSLLRDLQAEYLPLDLAPILIRVDGTLPPKVVAEQIARQIS